MNSVGITLDGSGTLIKTPGLDQFARINLMGLNPSLFEAYKQVSPIPLKYEIPCVVCDRKDIQCQARNRICVSYLP
jgi:hypothetical protein